MKWNDLGPQEQERVIALAAALHDAREPLPELAAIANRVTPAGLADYARGARTAPSLAAIRFALRTDPTLNPLLEQLLDHFAEATVPLAAAASSGTISKRRDPGTGLEITLAISSAEPSTVIMRLDAPGSLRPLHRLVVRGEDGETAEITVDDTGEDDVLELLIGRDSIEFRLLTDEDSRIWLS
jgi:hypothetical protein